MVNGMSQPITIKNKPATVLIGYCLFRRQHQKSLDGGSQPSSMSILDALQDIALKDLQVKMLTS